MRRSQTQDETQRGAVLVWYALFMVLMLGFIGLGVDVAKLATTRTQLQNAADAAALAAVSAIDSEKGEIDRDLAVSRAQFTASQNKAFVDEPEPVVVNPADVTFPSSTRVRVKVRREGGTSMVTHIAGVLGIPGLEVSASATAMAEITGSVPCGLVPLGITPPVSVGNLKAGCSPGYVLKDGGGPITSGNHGAVNFPPCPAGACAGQDPTARSAWRCQVENGYCCTVSIGQVVDTRPGNTTGALKDAVNTRFNADTDQRQNICYSEYTGNGRRVLFAPVTTTPGSGHSTVRVEGFAAFFLKNRPQNGNNDLLGEFIYTVIPGTGGGVGSGVALYSIRLID